MSALKVAGTWQAVKNIRQRVSWGFLIERLGLGVVQGGPGVVREPPSVLLDVGPGPVQILPAHPECEGVVSLSPAWAQVPRPAPAQDGDRLLSGGARVFENAPCVGLSLPRSRHRRQIRVLAETNAPPVAPAGQVVAGAGGHPVGVRLPAPRPQPVPRIGGCRGLPGAAPVSWPRARPCRAAIPVALRGGGPVSVGVLVCLAA